MKIEVTQGSDNDWFAVDLDTYDCDCDENGFFSTSPQGIGDTKLDAISDLLYQIEERTNA